MIINKGKYKNIKLGFGNINIANKEHEILIFSEDSKNIIGKATIVCDYPLTMNMTFTTDYETKFDYFSFNLMNYCEQNGCIISINAIRVFENTDVYTRLGLDGKVFTKSKKIKE